MKNRCFFFVIFISLCLTACSNDVLSKEKVKNLIQECDNGLYSQHTRLDELINLNYPPNKKQFPLYKKLEKDGYVKLVEVEGNFCHIKLTNKGRQYIEYVSSSPDNTYSSTFMKTNIYKINEVKEIEVAPELDSGEAQVSYVFQEKTPFYFFP